MQQQKVKENLSLSIESMCWEISKIFQGKAALLRIINVDVL